MSDGVIVTVTLNAALHVSYTADRLSADGVNPVARPVYRADGRGVTAARVLHAFGHDVLAAGLAGGTAGELIRSDLAVSGVPTAFTQIRGESRRVFSFVHSDGRAMKFGEPGPYITTEELGRFAADYRELLSQAAAVVLSGSLPDGLPAEMYGTLVTYAVEAGVPVVLDAGGEELLHAAAHRPDLAVADARRVRGDTDLGSVLVRLGAAAAAIAGDQTIRVVTGAGEWIASVAMPNGDVTSLPARGALVAGMIPGQLLGWSWPDRLKHALALAAGGAAEVTGSKDVDLAAYERLLDTVSVKHIARAPAHSRSASLPVNTSKSHLSLTLGVLGSGLGFNAAAVQSQSFTRPRSDGVLRVQVANFPRRYCLGKPSRRGCGRSGSSERDIRFDRPGRWLCAYHRAQPGARYGAARERLGGDFALGRTRRRRPPRPRQCG